MMQETADLLDKQAGSPTCSFGERLNPELGIKQEFVLFRWKLSQA